MPTLEDVTGELSFLDGSPAPADFLGVRPTDGETVGINPPGLAWPPEFGSVAFDLELSPEAEFGGNECLRFEGLTLNLHTLSEPLQEGRWYWRYRCRLQDGRVTPWSIVRSFTIAGGTPEIPVPSVTELTEKLGDAHPRLWARPGTLEELRRRCGEQPERWARLKAVIEEKLSHPFMEEPPPYPDGRWDVDIWRSHLVEARNMSSAIDYLGFGYLITGDRRYGDRLREWLVRLSRWDPEGTSSYGYNDEVGMPVLFVLAHGYDSGYDLLSDGERELVRESLRRRAEEVYRMFRTKNPYEVRPYDNHATRTINFLGQAALSLLGEVAEAAEWLDYVLKVYSVFYPPWGGEDGGYSQGPSYLSSYLNWMLQFLQMLESATGMDFHRKPFFRNVGWFILYAAPWCAKMVPFGDGTPGRPGRVTQLNMYRLAQKFREPAFQWYARMLEAGPSAAETVPQARRSSVESMPEELLEFLWRDDSVPAHPPSDRSRCFFSVGEAAMHSDLADAENDVYMLFKSSPFGAWSHAYADQNSFYIHGFGEPLAISSGYYPWYGSDHHTRWTWQTKAHNGVLVGGEGQMTGTRASRGKVEAFVSSPPFEYIRGDAVEAYAGRLTRFLRHVLYVRAEDGPGWFIIADDLESPEPATFQWLLHALSRMQVDAQSLSVTIVQGEARLAVNFLAPSDLSLGQTDRFDIPPERPNCPNQWHLTASTTSPSHAAGFLVALQPYRAGDGPPADIVPVEAKGWLACRLRSETGRTLVAMRQSGEAGDVAGVETDARFLALDHRSGRPPRALVVDGSALSIEGFSRVSWAGRRTEVVELTR